MNLPSAETVILGLALLLLLITLSNVLCWPRVRRAVPKAETSARVAVLIPARNEQANLADCLTAVLQQGESVSEILVYNDHSTDDTGAILARFQALDARVQAVAPRALPAGWCGKNFACAQLAQAARAPWLLFLDADARLLPEAVTRMVGEAERRRLTLLSCWPGLELVSFWEKALMPLLNFVVFTIFPGVLSLFRQEASLGLAHGACLLFERATYEKLGGHVAVREQIFEDTRLAQRWRTEGERSLGLDGQDIVRVRMYATLAEIWAGFQKNFFPAFQWEFNFWLFLVFHAAVLLAPFGLFLLTGARAYGWAAAAVWLMRSLLAWRFRQPLWSALLHPLTETLLLALGLSSWWRCKSGRGVAWKGREYHKAPEAL